MALGLRKISRIISFPHFFSLRTDIHLIFGTLLCHTKMQISLSFVFIHWFFTKLWPLDLKDITIFQFSALFSSLLTDIHLIFGTWLCHTKIQIKFKFSCHPLIFYEVMALGLRKILRIVRFFFFTFVVPPTGFAVQDRKQNIVLFCFNYFDWIYLR
jgi:hypothetical protein